VVCVLVEENVHCFSFGWNLSVETRTRLSHCLKNSANLKAPKVKFSDAWSLNVAESRDADYWVLIKCICGSHFVSRFKEMYFLIRFCNPCRLFLRGRGTTRSRDPTRTGATHTTVSLAGQTRAALSSLAANRARQMRKPCSVDRSPALQLRAVGRKVYFLWPAIFCGIPPNFFLIAACPQHTGLRALFPTRFRKIRALVSCEIMARCDAANEIVAIQSRLCLTWELVV